MMTDYYLEDKSRLKGQPFENFSYFPPGFLINILYKLVSHLG